MNEKTPLNHDIQSLQKQIDQLKDEANYYKQLADQVSGYNIVVDAEVIALKRDLDQKKEGNDILLGLHDLIGTNVDLDTFFNSTLELILTNLKIDKGVVLWKQQSNNNYKIQWHSGFEPEEDIILKRKELDNNLLDDHSTNGLLINKSTKTTEKEKELLNILNIPFIIGIPIKIENKISGWLICGRLKEASPFYPPLTLGNLETFHLIGGFIQATVSNNMLYQKLQYANSNLEEYNKALEKKIHIRTRDIEISKIELEEEKKKVDELLLNILPAQIAEELKRYGSSKAKRIDNVTVLFSDFVNFSSFAENLTPEELVTELDTCFRAFDEIISGYGIEKIKTIGDAYMCTGGLPPPGAQPADVINAALDIISFMRSYTEKQQKKFRPGLDIRIGIHHGPVISGVVGIKKFSFDIWGDTVNIASRLETSSSINKVNISGTLHAITKNDFDFEHRGKIKIKNKGELDMYFVQPKKMT